MNLEQRVDVVEQELNLIKAQIQEILLQIQEQLLKEAHPVLRGEEPRKAAATRSPEVVAAAPSAAPVQRVNSTAPTRTESPTTAERPATASRAYPQARQVRVEQQSAERPSAQPPSTRRPAPAPATPPPAKSNGHKAQPSAYQPAEVRVWIQLDQWVSQKVRELGIKRTRELINLCGEPERSLLLQFIDVYDEQSTPPAPAAPRQQRPNPQYADPQYPTGEPIYTRPVTNAPLPTPAEQWQQHANTKTRSDYSPFGEHQDLVLGLIKALLDDAQHAPAVMTNGNGNGHVNY